VVLADPPHLLELDTAEATTVTDLDMIYAVVRWR